MTDLKLLLKLNFLRFIAVFKGKKKERSNVSALCLLILAVLGVLALYSVQCTLMYKDLAPVGLAKMCVFLGVIISLSVLMIFAVMRTTTNNTAGDTDFLMTLPIKKSSIIVSKVLSTYLMDLGLTALTLAPYLVNYQIFTRFNWATTFLGLLTIFLLPLLSVGVTYIVNFLVVRLFNRTKYSKLFKTLFALTIYLAIMVLLYTKTFAMNDSLNSSNIEDFFVDRPISNMLLKFVTEPNWICALVVLAITLIPATIGLVAYYYNFGKSFEKFANKSDVLHFGDGKSTFVNLLNKEKSVYFNIPAYVINTIISPIMIVALSVVACIFINDDFWMTMQGIGFSKDMIIGCIAIIFSVFNSMGCISCSSISLEGGSMWILKTMPVNERLIFLSKIAFHIVIQLPAVIVASTLLTIFLHLSALQTAIIYVVPILFVVLLSLLGLVINLWLPKFEWDNETQVVKSSMAVLMVMVFGLIISIIPILLFKFLTALSILNIFLITIGLYLALIVFLLVFLMTQGVKIFRKLNV